MHSYITPMQGRCELGEVAGLPGLDVDSCELEWHSHPSLELRLAHKLYQIRVRCLGLLDRHLQVMVEPAGVVNTHEDSGRPEILAEVHE